MSKSKLPNSIRKYIRLTKAKIRREVLDPKKQEELILVLITKFIKNPNSVKAEVVTEKEVVIKKTIKATKEKQSVKSTKSSGKPKNNKSKK